MTVCHASDRSDEQESQGKKGKVVSLKQVFAKKKINPLSEIGGSKTIAEEKGSTSTERGPHGELRNVRVCLCWW